MSQNKPLVIVTRKLPDVIETRMMELFDTRLNVTDDPMSHEDLINAVKFADVLVPTVTDKIDADVIANAGQAGAVTVATNMAGRGTDIKLDPQVAANGGLHVIVSQMHSFARVDRQLIGRCARCGDPGSFRFFVASDDPLASLIAPWIGRAIRRSATSGGAASDSIQSHLTSAQKKQERVAASLRWRMLQADRDAQGLIKHNKVPGRCFSLVG